MGAHSSAQKTQLVVQRSTEDEFTPAAEADAAPKRALLSLRESLQYVLQQTAASADQCIFLEQWLQLVFDPAYSETKGSVGLVVSTDLTVMEVSVTTEFETGQDLAEKFLTACGGQLEVMAHLSQVHEVVVSEDVALWCRLKRMGSDSPAVDIGFELQGQLSWVAADMMMPPIPDMETLREYARQRLLIPCSYGCSLLPTEPEQFLTFDLSKAANISKNSLYAGLFFFKALGLAKPEDRAVRALADMMPSRVDVRCFMGPKGLTRLSMMAFRPVHADPSSLVNALDSCCHSSLHGLPKKLNSTPIFVHFMAEERGFTVAIGFQL